MSWECPCGIINKDSRINCQGCGLTLEETKKHLAETPTKEEIDAEKDELGKIYCKRLKSRFWVVFILLGFGFLRGVILVGIGTSEWETSFLYILDGISIGISALFIFFYWSYIFTIAKLASLTKGDTFRWVGSLIIFFPISFFVTYISMKGTSTKKGWWPGIDILDVDDELKGTSESGLTLEESLKCLDNITTKEEIKQGLNEQGQKYSKRLKFTFYIVTILFLIFFLCSLFFGEDKEYSLNPPFDVLAYTVAPFVGIIFYCIYIFTIYKLASLTKKSGIIYVGSLIIFAPLALFITYISMKDTATNNGWWPGINMLDVNAESISAPLPVNNPEIKLCPYCDEKIKYEAIKCKHCGSMLKGTMNKYMNKKQIIVLLLGIVLLLSSGIYPPWKHVKKLGSGKGGIDKSYGWVFSPPAPKIRGKVTPDEGRWHWDSSIDISLLSVQWGIIAISTFGFYILFKDK